MGNVKRMRMDKEPIEAYERSGLSAARKPHASGGPPRRSTSRLWRRPPADEPAGKQRVPARARIEMGLLLLLVIIGCQQVLAAPDAGRRAAGSAGPFGWPELPAWSYYQPQPAQLSGALRFQVEPPALVEYSNTSGAVIPCRPYVARGTSAAAAAAAAATAATATAGDHLHGRRRQLEAPAVSVSWKLVRQVPGGADELTTQLTSVDEPLGVAAGRQVGARHVRPDGALVLAPFGAHDYRPDIHAATYRCCISNQRARLCSNPVRARPVIDSTLILEVFDEFALAGNSALLKCQPTPAHLARHLRVLSWSRNERLLVSAETAGKLPGNSKYLMLNSGELLIANASQSDAALYKCSARHRLTGQLLVSRIGGRLMVDSSGARHELKSSAQAREQALQVAREHSSVLLCARTQSQPVARHVWYMEPLAGGSPAGGSQRRRIELGADSSAAGSEVRQINQAGDCIHIPQASADLHSALYTCEADNGISRLQVSTRLLIVPAQLSVQLQLTVKSPTGSGSSPQSHQQQTLVAAGSSVQLNCSIGGAAPFNTIAWLKDGSLIAVSNLNNGSVALAGRRVRMLHPSVINIASFEPQDRGLYQCQVYSARPAQRASQLLRARGVPEEESEAADGSGAAGELEELQLSLSAGAALHVDLAASAPNFATKLAARTLEAGAPMSLQCQASGAPPPRLFWFLDKQLILGPSDEEQQQQQQLLGAPATMGASAAGAANKLTAESDISATGRADEAAGGEQWSAGEDLEWQKLINSHYQAIKESRFQMSTWTSATNLVTSQLNISRLSGAETGEYKCLAVNSQGSVAQSAHVHVIGGGGSGGGLHLRPYQAQNVTLIAGRAASLQCPLVGFPVSRVDWFRAGRRLPENHRQHVQPVRGGSGGQLELVNIDPVADAGTYTCRVQLQVDNGTALSEPDTEGSAHLQVSVQVPPLIEAQSLPETLQTNEGMRTKLLCSVVQGDHPVEIRWLKQADRFNKSPGRASPLVGFELMQNILSPERLQDAGSSEDLVTIHNLEDSSLLTFRQIAHSDSGEYACIAQNEAGRTVRYTRIVVNIAPTWLAEPVPEVNVLLGTRLELECFAFGQPAPSVTWKRSIVKGAANTWLASQEQPQDVGQLEYMELASNYRHRALHNGTLVMQEVELADAGFFMCEVSNGIGAGLSRVTRVRVNVPPHFKQRSGSQFAQIKTTTELRCTVLGNQPMTVTWSRAHLEDPISPLKEPRHRFVNERSLSPEVYESVLVLNKLARNDSGQYICSASNEFGVDEARLQLFVQEVPEGPVLLKPVRAGSRQATLTFRPPFAGNSPIKRYEISYRHFQAGEELQLLAQSNASWQQVILDPALEASYANQSEPSQADSSLVHLNLCCLQPFTRYLVRVRALNDVGWSEPSKPAQFITDEEPIGGPPLDVGVEATGAHSLKVRWRPPARHLQNGLIRGYYIGYRAQPSASSSSSSSSQRMQTSNPSSLSSTNVKVFEAEGGEQYQYKNVQLDLGLATFQQGALPADAALINLQLYQNYSAPQVLTSYLINLRRKTSYSVIVQAYNKLGASPRSDELIVSTLDAAPPMSPLLRVLSSTHNSALLSWSARRFIYEQPHQQQPLNGTRFNGAPNQQQQQQQQAPHQLAAGADSLMSNVAEMAAEYEDDDPQFYYTINFRADRRHSVATFIDNHHRHLGGGGGSLSSISAANLDAGAASDELADDSWHQRRVPRRQPLPFVLTGLRCGSHHSAFMTATNSLGQSEPGDTVRFTTQGGAPVAPVDARHFLQLNASSALLRLSAWHHAGCPIAFYLIKYRASDQSKWTIFEHQPTPHGSSPPPAMSLFGASPAGAQLPADAGGAQDFVIKNLAADSLYRLVVEAHSEAGHTVAEYELEMANLTCSIISVHVNGLVAATDSAGANSQPGRNGPEQGDDMDFSFIGGQRSGPPLLLRAYSMGTWSITMLFVLISALMIGAALVLALRGLLRHKPNSNSLNGNHHHHPGGPRTGGGLLSTVFCCSPAGAYAGSNPDGSQSSGSGGTCYQAQSMDHCALHDELKSMANEAELVGGGLPFRQLVNSSSLSTIAAVSSGHQTGAALGAGVGPRHTLTLGSAAHCQAARRLNTGASANHYELGGGHLSDLSPGGAHLRAHYASTLGPRQRPLFLKNSQPIKYNASTSVYGQLLAAAAAAATDTGAAAANAGNNNLTSEEQQYATQATTNNYQLCNGGPQQQQQSTSLTLSSTSGFHTTNSSLKTDASSALQLPYCLQSIDASQVSSYGPGSAGVGSLSGDSGAANLFPAGLADAQLRVYAGGPFEQEDPVTHNQGHQCLYNNGAGFGKPAEQLLGPDCQPAFHQLQHHHGHLLEQQQQQQLPTIAYGMIYGRAGELSSGAPQCGD